MCAHSCLTREDTDPGPHVFHRCKNPKPLNQERNKVQISFLFSQGFCYLYIPNGKGGSIVNSLQLYIKLCNLTLKCHIILPE